MRALTEGEVISGGVDMSPKSANWWIFCSKKRKHETLENQFLSHFPAPYDRHLPLGKHLARANTVAQWQQDVNVYRVLMDHEDENDMRL